MRVTILHNAVPPDAPPEDQDTLVEVDAVSTVLTRLGHAPTTVACSLDLATMQEDLLRLRPDVVFNLVESLAGADSLVYLPAAVLDTLAIPYCGSRTESLFLTTHKTLAKQRLRGAGLPTPEWVSDGSYGSDRSYGSDDNDDKLQGSNHGFSPCFSWIIKGVWDQGSRGMDDDAVVRNVGLAELRERLSQRVARSGRPCFAEQFIEGREFNVSVLAINGDHVSPCALPGGHETLPPAEIVFSDFPPDKPRIVGHRAKWDEDSFECRNTTRRFDFPASDRALLAGLSDLAHQCWTLFELRGWARVDFRVDAAGQPWILEVNANPCISPDAGFAAALQRASISYDEAIRRILGDCHDPTGCSRHV
jgi:D-alanine-D-alanine ligase